MKIYTVYTRKANSKEWWQPVAITNNRLAFVQWVHSQQLCNLEVGFTMTLAQELPDMTDRKVKDGITAAPFIADKATAQAITNFVNLGITTLTPKTLDALVRLDLMAAKCADCGMELFGDFCTNADCESVQRCERCSDVFTAQTWNGKDAWLCTACQNNTEEA